MMARWQVGKGVLASMAATNRMTVGLALLAILPTCQLAAQVGHDPARSPFRDIATRQSIAFWGGTFSGDRAVAGVGAQSGPMFGFRLRTALSGPIDLMVSSSYVQSKRNVIDAAKPESTRVSGPSDYNLVITDIAVGLTLTGLKTWHGLAPYVAFGVGLVTPTHTVIDPGGYKAGSGFTFAPTIGVRLRVSRSLMLQVEARDNTIRYEWPNRYFFPIDANGNDIVPPVLPTTERNKQLTHNLSLTAGLSYNFNF
jgi:hypothetical protein